MAHFTFDFIFALAIVYGTSLGFSFLRRWDIPVLAVEILAGMVFGAGLGIITSDSPGFGFFVSLAALGLLLIMFDAGLELDPDVIRRNPGRIGTLAAFTFLLPFGSGFALASSLGLSVFASFLTGVTVSTTSLGLIYPLLEDFDLLGTDRGQVILAVVVLNDLLSVAALAYGITLGTSSAPLLGAGVVTVALVVLFFIVPFVLEPHISNTLREGIVNEPAKIGMFLMVGLALILDHLGIHAILGAFFAGLLIATITHEGHEIERSMKPVIDLGAPVFFFYVGMNFHVTSLFQADALLIATVVLLGLGSKAIGALIGGALTDLPRRTTFLLAAAMPGRLSISVAAAEIGLERGIIQPALYDAFVILSVISVFVSVFAFRTIFWNRSATGGMVGAG